MAWANSKIFVQWQLMMMGTFGTGYAGLAADTVNVALFGTTPTPDNTVAANLTGYNTGQWISGSEIVDVTNWTAGGRALAGKTFTNPSTNLARFDGNDLAGGGNVTLAGVFGDLTYDNTISGGTVAKQGICFNYFGGSQSVTAGTFTIIWNSNGLAQWTLT